MTDITVKELLEYAVEGEHSVLAHMIFWSMTTQGIAPEDDSNKLKDLDFDREAITALVKNNVLGMGQIKLFVVKVNVELFAFYFARNVLEVNNLHNQLFGNGKSIIEAPKLMHKLMYVDEMGEQVLLIDYRKRYIEYPVYIGHARANEYYLERQ